MSPLRSSSSTAESGMDNNSNTTVTTTNTNKHKLRQRSANRKAFNKNRKYNYPEREEEEEEEEEGVPEVWASFNNSFRQVQTVLDRNRVLIQQVNENHQSKIPDNMIKNVALIQEINGNISKVVSLYSDLSTNFTGAYHQRKNGTDSEREGRGA